MRDALATDKAKAGRCAKQRNQWDDSRSIGYTASFHITVGDSMIPKSECKLKRKMESVKAGWVCDCKIQKRGEGAVARRGDQL